jgi:hypothetical protein
MVTSIESCMKRWDARRWSHRVFATNNNVCAIQHQIYYSIFRRHRTQRHGSFVIVLPQTEYLTCRLVQESAPFAEHETKLAGLEGLPALAEAYFCSRVVATRTTQLLDRGEVVRP